MIWTHRDLRAHQVPVHSRDLTAVLVHLEDRTVPAVLVHIPAMTTSDDEELHSRLELIREAAKTVRRSHRHQVELVIVGDFNRHDQMWGETW